MGRFEVAICGLKRATGPGWAALSTLRLHRARGGHGGKRAELRPAVEISVFVVRAFVRMSRMVASHRQLALKLAELEARVSTHDRSIQSLLAAIRSLIAPPEPKKKRIGFVTEDDKPGQTGPGSDFIARDRPARKHRNR